MKNRFKQGAAPQENDYEDWLDTMQSMGQQTMPKLQVLTECDLKVDEYAVVEHGLDRYATPTVLKDDGGAMVPVECEWMLKDEKTVLVRLKEGGESGPYKILIK